MKLKKKIEIIVDNNTHPDIAMTNSGFVAEIMGAIKKHKAEKKAHAYEIQTTIPSIMFKQYEPPPTITIFNDARIEIPQDKTITVIFMDKNNEPSIKMTINKETIRYTIH